MTEQEEFEFRARYEREIGQQAKPSASKLFAQEVRNSIPGRMVAGIPDALAGALRGAGSIGATLLAPFDIAEEKIAGAMGAEMPRMDRRTAMTDALQTLGADVKSPAFAAGKIGGEVAGTLGVAPALAMAVPARLAAQAPMLVNSIRSSGMTLGGTTGSRLADLGIRTAGGAISGGATAGLVDPSNAGAGAVIGGSAPAVIQGAGAAGRMFGERAQQKAAEFARKAPQRETLQAGIDAGYVVPPNLVNPSTKNAIIESFSGKQATAQIASVRNQQVTEKLVRQSLGLSDDVPLTKGALEQIRKIEGGAYKRVGDLSDDARMALEELKQARNEAQGWFNAYNRSASPADLAKAKGFRETADNLENFLEFEAVKAGKEELIPALKAARQQIAKTYTVERAFNEASGTVNARVLGRMYEKGTPLTGGLKTAGRFASAFPSVAQPSQQMGSPAAHNLRSMASLLMGGGGAAAAGPAGLAAGALPFITGPASRGLMFREGAQKALANPSTPAASELARLLQDPTMQMLLSRSAPVIAANRQ